MLQLLVIQLHFQLLVCIEITSNANHHSFLVVICVGKVELCGNVQDHAYVKWSAAPAVYGLELGDQSNYHVLTTIQLWSLDSIIAFINDKLTEGGLSDQ